MISGGIKFFDKSAFVYGSTGVSVVASSGDVISSFMLDKNPITAWQSSSSTDLITETITITFPLASISRLFFRKINWKQFTVQYDVSGVWTNFAGVVGLDTASGVTASSISETTFSDTSAYYEFTEVETTSIRIQVVKTQTANAQKYCSQIIGTTELGTLEGYPNMSNWLLKRNQKSKKVLSGKYQIQKGEPSFECKLEFKNYPASYTNDLDLMFDLFDREEPFHIWLCGGRRKTASSDKYFRYQPQGAGLDDIYLVQLDSDLEPGFMKNIYTCPINLGNLVFREVGGNSPDTEEDVSSPQYNIALSLPNNQSATEFLVIDHTVHHRVIMKYNLYRTDSLNSLADGGTIDFIYVPGTDTWIVDGPRPTNDGTSSGVTFSTNYSAGLLSVKVATSNLLGTGYTSGCKYSLEYFDAP